MKRKTQYYLLILFALFSLSFVVYNYITSKYEVREKEAVLSESNIKNEPAATPSLTPTATPTLTPGTKTTVQKNESNSTPVTPTYVYTKVPVYLVHDGSTRMCEQSASPAVTSASQSLKDANQQYQSCYDQSTSQTKSCGNSCKTKQESDFMNCFKLHPDLISQCTNDATVVARYCLDQCAKNVLICPDNRNQYQSGLDSLVSQYCN